MTSRPFDFELNLSRHGNALRQLAVELLRDRTAAEDAVQEVWLRAVRSPPQHELAIGGWLVTMLRNVASRLRRGEQRRLRRERLVAREDEIEDHAVVLAREELLHRLVAEVSALDAPFREVIWQRYFVGMAPREIAQSTGVPIATVKSRLQRGLQQLREKLGEEGESDWRSALAVAFGLKEGAVPAGTAAMATTWPGVLVMTAWTKSVAALAMVATIVLLWWSLHEPNAPPSLASADQTAATRTAPSAMPVAKAPEAVVREAAPAPAAPPAVSVDSPPQATARLFGRTVDAETRQPAPGVEVRWNHSDRLVPSAEDGRVRTGLDGRFEIEVQPDKAGTTVVVLTAGGFVSRFAFVSAIAVGQVEDLGDVTLRRGRRIAGRVVLEHSLETVAEVGLSFWFAQKPAGRWGEMPASARTEAGRFVSSGALPLGKCTVSIQPCPFELVEPKDLEVTDTGPEELVVVVRHRPQIRGIVVDENGEPVADVGLSTQGLSAVEVITAADGTFVLTRTQGQQEAAATVFVADAGPCDPPPSSRQVAWGTGDLRIVLRRSPPFVVEVIGPDGTPIEEFGVAVDRPGSQGSQRHKVKQRGPHPGGRLAVASVSRGRTSVRVVPEAVEWSASGPIPVGDVEPLRIVLQRRVPCAVQVTAADRPVAGAFVEYVHERVPLTAQDRSQLPDPRDGVAAVHGVWPESLSSGRTDAGGMVSLWRDESQAGRVLRVQCEKQPPLVVRELVFPADGAPLRVELPAVGSIAGRIELRGRSRNDVLVRIRFAQQEQLVQPQPDGSFAHGPVPVGTCTVALLLRAGPLGLSPVGGFEHEVRVVTGDPANVMFDLAELVTSSVRGKIVSAQPLPTGLEVDFVRRGRAEDGMQVLGSAVVGADGSFAVGGLWPGTYHVAFRLAPLATTFVPALQAEPIVLVGGDQLVRELSFTRRKLTVRFVWPDGSPAKGHRSCARCAGGMWPANAIFAPTVGETLVLDPAPALPIEFGSRVIGAAWSAAVQMPQDRAEAEVTVVLPDTRR